jgi:hypothetical protein
MTPTNKATMRAAVLIHEQLAGSKSQVMQLYLPEYSWNNIQRIRRHIDLARQRGWHRAASRLTEDLATALENCRHELENALRALQTCLTDRQASSASDICRDILALHEEFEELDIDLKRHELSVTTDSIVLEGIDFGPFDIRLDWQRLGEPRPYRVVACDPNPAARDAEVTHPHVQGETLCEGDGRPAIQAALAQCRIYDFYLLVSQTLHTYARGSAYVELDHWSGITCDDCGASMSEDDSYCCQRCGSELCDDCRQLCAACEESHCSGCLSGCPECGRDFCRGCMEVCSGCHRKVCGRCMEDGQCPSCQTKHVQEEEEGDDKHVPATNPGDGESPDRAGTDGPSLGTNPVDDATTATEEEPCATAEPDRLGQALVRACPGRDRGGRFRDRRGRRSALH